MRSILKEEIKKIKGLITINEDNVGGYMDSTYLKTPEQAGIGEEETDVIIFDTIKDAIKHNIKLVMIRPEYVKAARQFIDEKGSNLLVGTVIGFPYGNNSLGEKIDEAMEAIKNGVNELDFVVDYRAFLRGNRDKVMKEVSEGTAIGIEEGKVVKWIIESAALTEEEIADLTSLIRDIVIETVGEQQAINVFVKTSTGFFNPEGGGPGGATEKAVSIMSQNAGPLQVKASGGIYSRQDLDNMVGAGASRIGTSVAKEIMLGQETENDY